MKIDSQDTMNVDLVAQAYLAPTSSNTPKYRPHNVRFWTAVMVLVAGQSLLLVAFALMYKLDPRVFGGMILVGILSAWQLARWIDPRIVHKTSSRTAQAISALGMVPSTIILLVIIFLQPGTNFSEWYINPVAIPVAWSIISQGGIQLLMATRESLVDRE